MDNELWASLLSATKRRLAATPHHRHHHHHHHHYRGRSASQDDAADADEDTRFEFLCPYCYSEFDIGHLCSHLDEEHCFESKPVVCPVCVAKVSSDLVEHITLQHGNLFKMNRRRRLKKTTSSTSDACSTALSLDRLISSLLSDLPIPEDEKQLRSRANDQDSILKSHTKQNSKREAPTENNRSEIKGAELRVKFVQQMILSTMFRDY